MNASRLVSLFLCLSLALPCAAFADTAPASGQKTDAPASTPKPVPDPTQDVWTTLLQNRVEELGAIDAETVALTKRLPDASRKLNAALSGIEEEYQRLMTLSRVSRGLPLELSVVQQRLARLNDNLSDVLEPLEGTLNTLKSPVSYTHLAGIMGPLRGESRAFGRRIRRESGESLRHPGRGQPFGSLPRLVVVNSGRGARGESLSLIHILSGRSALMRPVL